MPYASSILDKPENYHNLRFRRHVVILVLRMADAPAPTRIRLDKARLSAFHRASAASQMVRRQALKSAPDITMRNARNPCIQIF